MSNRNDSFQGTKSNSRPATVHNPDLIKRNTLFPVKSTPSKLANTLDPINRKSTTASVSKTPRDASFSRKTPKNNESSFFNTSQSFGRRTMVMSAGNTGSQQVKVLDPIKKPTTTYSTFTERFSRLQQHSILPNYEPSRSSQKSYGVAKAFGVCTNIGLVRDYNEDRVSIVLDIPRPTTDKSTEPWPSCSLFALFDGHGGAKCADFLRNNLHYYIARSKHFPKDPEETLKEACELIEKRFIEAQLVAAESGKCDTSGSCGLIMLVIGDNCYIANIGDSRAVVSKNGGKLKQAITKDHKPSDEMEKTRVINAGGRIYQNFPSAPTQRMFGTNQNPAPQLNNAPHRILPGGLAVSRAFGDIEAKLPQFGGNPDVLIAKPDITTVKITDMVDFIVLGSDGIYDVMTDTEVAKSIWETVERRETTDIHELMRKASENLIKDSLMNKSFDNVTVLIVAFPALEQKINSLPPMVLETETKEPAYITPRPTPPKKTEEETAEQLNVSPPQDANGLRSNRPCKTSPSKTLVTPPRRALFKREGSGKKEFETPKIRERSEKRAQTTLPRLLPKIATRKSVNV